MLETVDHVIDAIATQSRIRFITADPRPPGRTGHDDGMTGTSSRPHDLPIVDLMVELPRGGAGMGMDQARRLLKDAGSDEFAHHPAEYLFKNAGDQMGTELAIDGLVALMDTHGITTAQIDVDPRAPRRRTRSSSGSPGASSARSGSIRTSG